MRLQNKIFLFLALILLNLSFTPFISATIVYENTTNGFHTSIVMSTSISGIGKIGDYMYIRNTANIFTSKISLVTFTNQTGFTSPSHGDYGITGNSTDEYFVSNSNVFLTHTKGGVNQTDGCSLAGIAGGISPIGIWGNNSGMFWITDDGNDKVYLIDSTCNKLKEISLGAIGAQNPYAMIGNESTLQIGDGLDVYVYCIDLDGTNRSDCAFDPKPFGLSGLTAMTSNASNIWIGDAGADNFIYNIHYYSVPELKIVYWDNESLLNVNSSNYWNDMSSFNSSQMTNYDGVLNILVSWLDTEITSIFNSLFRNYFNQNLNKTDTPTFTGINITGDYIYNGNNRYSFSELNATGSEGTSFTYYNLTNSDIIASNNEGVIILTLPLTSGKNISIECNLLVDSASITTGIQLNSTLSGTSSRRQLIEYYDPINSPNVCSSNSESLMCAPLISAGETTTSSKINIYAVQSNVGIYELKLMSSVSGSNVYVRAGSWCRSIEF